MPAAGSSRPLSALERKSDAARRCRTIPHLEMVAAGLQVCRHERLRRRRVLRGNEVLALAIDAAELDAHRTLSAENLDLQPYAVRSVRFHQQIDTQRDRVEVELGLVSARL